MLEVGRPIFESGAPRRSEVSLHAVSQCPLPIRAQSQVSPGGHRELGQAGPRHPPPPGGQALGTRRDQPQRPPARSASFHPRLGPALVSLLTEGAVRRLMLSPSESRLTRLRRCARLAPAVAALTAAAAAAPAAGARGGDVRRAGLGRPGRAAAAVPAEPGQRALRLFLGAGLQMVRPKELKDSDEIFLRDMLSALRRPRRRRREYGRGRRLHRRVRGSAAGGDGAGLLGREERPRSRGASRGRLLMAGTCSAALPWARSPAAAASARAWTRLCCCSPLAGGC